MTEKFHGSSIYAKNIFQPRLATVWFSVRTFVASTVALLIAFALKLDSPQWAAITVWIVAQPSRGMTLSKGFYRMIGTAVGTLMAVILIQYFADSPWLFILILAVWMGICSMTANLVRYQRSYGAVLAGYTTSIVAILVFNHTDHIHEVAQARVECVFLGMIVATLFSFITGSKKNKEELFDNLRGSVAKSLRWFALIASSQSREENNKIEREILFDMAAIEEKLSYAAAESLQISMRLRIIQNLIAGIISLMSSIQAFHSVLEKRPDFAEKFADSLKKVANMSEELANELLQRHILSEVLLQRLTDELSELSKKMTTTLSSQSLLTEKIKDLSVAIQSVAESFESLNAEKSGWAGSFHLSHYRDWKLAQIAAVRAVIGVIVAGAIWILTKWHDGPILVMMAAVNCGLFSTRLNPREGVSIAIKGSLFAYAAAFLCGFVFLNEASPEWWVLTSQALFLVPAGFLIPPPLTSLAGAVFAANYLVFFSPVYPYHFKTQTFLDLGLGFFAGSVVSWLAFRWIVTPTPEQQIENIKKQILGDLKRIASGRYKSREALWETVMYNRLGQLIRLSIESPTTATRNIEGGLVALYIGRKLQRVQREMDISSSSAKFIQGALGAFESIIDQPQKTIQELRFYGVQISEHSLRDTFQEMADSLEGHRDLFVRTRPPHPS